jgi:hypothetical protein
MPLLPADRRIELPAYAYTPGAGLVHPHHPGGHGFRVPAGVDPVRVGLILARAGFFWEAHEAWEMAWHAHGRHGVEADLLKGLIKLAAAGVKARQNQPHGLRIHARNARRLFRSLASSPCVLGLSPGHLAEIAEGLEQADPQAAPGQLQGELERVPLP